jgi:hypothetical protein
MAWVETDWVCSNCVGDTALQAIIDEEGELHDCVRCAGVAKSISFQRLCELVDEVYKAYYVPGHLIGDETTGDFPEEIIAEMISDTGHGLADAVSKFLHEAEAYEVAHDGEEGLYDPASRYEFDYRVTEPHELGESWQAFSERVKFQGRFFNESVKQFLDELVAVLRVAAGGRGGTFTALLEPGTMVYRARSAKTHAEVVKIEANPEEELGPPPRFLRNGGRMNAPGIAAFYGAFTREVCISEVRPSVGGYVVSAAFEVVRPLGVLNLPAFGRTVSICSMFDSDFAKKATYLRFLQRFHRELTRPVLPGDETIEYLPTQVMLEYFANVVGLEGVIFSSAQAATQDHEDARNIALFNAAGIVEVPGKWPEKEQEIVPVAEGGERRFQYHELPPPPPVERRNPVLRLVRGSVGTVQVKGITVSHIPAYAMEHYMITHEDIDLDD